MDKKTLRTSFLQHRCKQSWELEQACIAEYLKNYFSLTRHRCVGLYWPIKNEIDVRDVLCDLLEGGVIDTLALPKLIDQRMQFVKWNREVELVVTRMGLTEPISEQEVFPDILLVPCVAMDADGYRLGYGGGYFDRYLKNHPTKAVGILAHDFLIERLPHECHDCALDTWVTEQGWKKDANR